METSYASATISVLRWPLRRGDRVLQKDARCQRRHADALEGQSRQVNVHARQRGEGDARIAHDRRDKVMASDGRNTGNPKFDGFALSVNAKDDADADRLFNGLSTGGKVVMPLGKTFFSPRFGMTQDKFGVNWMVIVEPN